MQLTRIPTVPHSRAKLLSSPRLSRLDHAVGPGMYGLSLRIPARPEVTGNQGALYAVWSWPKAGRGRNSRCARSPVLDHRNSRAPGHVLGSGVGLTHKVKGSVGIMGIEPRRKCLDGGRPTAASTIGPHLHVSKRSEQARPAPSSGRFLRGVRPVAGLEAAVQAMTSCGRPFDAPAMSNARAPRLCHRPPRSR